MLLQVVETFHPHGEGRSEDRRPMPGAWRHRRTRWILSEPEQICVFTVLSERTIFITCKPVFLRNFSVFQFSVFITPLMGWASMGNARLWLGRVRGYGEGRRLCYCEHLLWATLKCETLLMMCLALSGVMVSLGLVYWQGGVDNRKTNIKLLLLCVFTSLIFVKV